VRRNPVGTVRPVEQCRALIKERTLTLEQRLQGCGFHDLPTSDEQCSRTTGDDVCGIPLCGQHRDMVTQWVDGREELNARAARLFEEWRVTPTAPFVGEHELIPAPPIDAK